MRIKIANIFYDVFSFRKNKVIYWDGGTLKFATYDNNVFV